MKISKIIFALFVALPFCLFSSQPVLCQTETLDIVHYTPPKGWSRTPKEGAVVFSDVNKTTNAFCILTVYASTPTAGSPQKDFANKWDEFVVKPFKGGANPKNETQPASDGWQATAGAAQIQMEGLTAYAILTVFSGFGKTASVLAILNDESYVREASAVIDSIKFDTTVASTGPTPTVQNDPFPDRPGYEPQKPLMGTLHPSITMADLVGTWGQGAGSVQTYVDSYTGDYSHTSTSFYGEQYVIKDDGTFEYRFVGRANNSTVRESARGTVVLENGYITIRFEPPRASQRYQFIAFMTQPNGAAILSLVPVHDSFEGYFGERMTLECGHSRGYISCVNGEEWARLPH